MRDFRLEKIHAIFPIFLAIFLIQFWGLTPYYDDLHRFSSTTTNLANQGRPFTEWLYFTYNLFESKIFPNIYNFNLVAIWFISILSYFLVVRKHDENLKVPVTALFICIFSSPGIIQSMAFHVDNIGMTISMMASVIAGSFVRNLSLRCVLAQTLTLCVATFFYQLSFNYYIAASAIFLLLHSLHNKVPTYAIARASLVKLIPIFCAVSMALLYKHFFAHDQYFNEHSSFMTVQDFLNGRLTRNINVMSWALSLTYNNLQLLVFKILTFLSFASWLYMMIKASSRRDAGSALSLLIAPPVVCLMVVLPSLLVYNPVIEQRTLTTVSLVLALLVCLCINIRLANRISVWCISILSVFNIMTASAFVSAQNYSTERTSMILSDVYYHVPDNYFSDDGSVTIYVPMSKTPSKSGEMINNLNYFPPLRMMVMDYFYSAYQTNALLRYKNIGMNVTYTKELCATKPLIVRRNYTISDCDGVPYVQFK
ncbi:glucosyltransferase domain-containing protein [Cronobacter malonaticus]|uniref:glucosyltransferase domain-containing protein n=2 Tax=Cronobacter malonaticus TaxID=413503 RepID=UPI00029C3DEA|nr:glucosyltransferase domain-containing protein [Cronobacter malonaticus]CCJ92971.1 hypothetical protein BN131_644 [Cronobacter malonaticus 681]ELY4445658.1 glucosyltransferase domain-containing protein [Cronobacter malonaticus]ELY4488604.1 glucosyltransferase domain-containing protein [Cronobacter malonaticus]ELY6230553.1 glucosyltransferase domain-containing protein [Cronobacter malonaticus]ELY6294762.1 glucosyltransferase domain-containing protein [Cronobacter malonaticus]